jgi:hypothetical protein
MEVAMLGKKRAFLVVLFLSIFVFSGSAYAIKFTGDAWVAQHISGGEPTDDFYLVISNSDMGNLKKVKLKGFSLKTPSGAPDFFYLTGARGDEGVSYLQIDSNSKKFRKLEKKARKLSAKQIKKGRLEAAERDDWMDAWITGKLEKSLYKLNFKDEDGKKYGAKIGFTTFENPVDYSDILEPPAGGDEAAPVPEPTTMLLLGIGLAGLAAFRRRFK